MEFTIVGHVTGVEVIAKGLGIRRLKVLKRRYGGTNWRKMKGVAAVIAAGGATRWDEIHWYEAHGVGRRGWKIKRFLD